MKKIMAIAAIVAAAQIAGVSAFADSSTGPDIEKAKESASVVNTIAENFPTRIVNDSSLPNGIDVVVQEGKPGERTFYKASENLLGTDGGFTSVPILYDEITTLPTEKVVRRGSNAAIIDGVSDKTKASEKSKAEEKVAAEAKKKADDAAAQAAKVATENAQSASPQTQVESAASATLAPAPSSSGVTSPEENKAYARSILSVADFVCLNFIAEKESGWSTTATNASSGAYGLAQSLPAGKMASSGADYLTNGKTQVNWMVGYLTSRYGSPCGGMAFWQIHHWY